MNLNMQATPNATTAHAAFVSCQAARLVLRQGGTQAQAALARDKAYAAVMRGER